MAEFGLEEKKRYDLKLGSSFKPRKENAFHTVRYDFKPASVDTSKPSELMVGKNNDITVVLPHVQESGSTTFKGSKRPCGKECILIIDKNTGAITLERISSSLQLKKIRSSSGIPAMTKPLATLSPISMPKIPPKTNSSKPKPVKQPNQESAALKVSTESVKAGGATSKPVTQHVPSKEMATVAMDLNESGSDSSSSDSDSDDSDSDGDEVDLQEQGEALQLTLNAMEPDEKQEIFPSSLHEDLRLSDCESDSE